MSSETSSESLSLFYSFRVGLKVTKMSKDFKMRTFSHCNLLTNFDGVGLARLAQLKEVRVCRNFSVRQSNSEPSSAKSDWSRDLELGARS